MSIRKPLIQNELKEIDIDALIDKGAKVKEDLVYEDKWTYISIRIQKEMIKNIDQEVKKRAGITRTGWILETLFERLKKCKKAVD